MLAIIDSLLAWDPEVRTLLFLPTSGAPVFSKVSRQQHGTMKKRGSNNERKTGRAIYGALATNGRWRAERTQRRMISDL
jgi:hypothetical protein